jgi:hypothetical protein
MGDHFWPALYPGLIIGLLYGLSLGGIANVILAALGGLAGLLVSIAALSTLGINEGLISVLFSALMSFAGAYAFTRIKASAQKRQSSQ